MLPAPGCRAFAAPPRSRATTRARSWPATDELLRALIEANDLEPDDIVSALFTVTRDLDAAFPARAAEEYGWNIVALLHGTEIPVPGSLPRCIRLLVHAYTSRTRGEIKHCYLRGATVLRPDRA